MLNAQFSRRKELLVLQFSKGSGPADTPKIKHVVNIVHQQTAMATFGLHALVVS